MAKAPRRSMATTRKPSVVRGTQGKRAYAKAGKGGCSKKK